MKNNSKMLWSLLGCAVAVLVFCSLCVPSALGVYFYLTTRSTPVALVTKTEPITPPLTSTPDQVFTVTPLDPVITPTWQPEIPTPTIGGQLVQPAIPALSPADQTIESFEKTIVPINDLVDLAQRLQGKQNLPRSLEFPVDAFQVGDRRSFWVTDTDTNQNTQVDASLAYVTDHVYFWVEEGVRYRERDLKALVDTFESQIYPRNREFFGSEWTPGVDADPRLYILYASGLGGSVAGYFSSADQYLPQVREDSNGHEMFLINADHGDLADEFSYGLLAHEFQHMIHWYGDRNEETWMKSLPMGCWRMNFSI